MRYDLDVKCGAYCQGGQIRREERPDDGEWVPYEDVFQLTAERDALKAALRKLQNENHVVGWHGNAIIAKALEGKP